jgi:hypothetical protein
MDKRVCESCNWAHVNDIGDLVCICAVSPHCADWVDPEDTCGKWEVI